MSCFNSVGHIFSHPYILICLCLLFKLFKLQIGHSYEGYIIGNKEKERISKRVVQEYFPKNKHLLPPDTHGCAYQGVRNVRFSENLAFFVFL